VDACEYVTLFVTDTCGIPSLVFHRSLLGSEQEQGGISSLREGAGTRRKGVSDNNAGRSFIATLLGQVLQYFLNYTCKIRTLF